MTKWAQDDFQRRKVLENICEYPYQLRNQQEEQQAMVPPPGEEGGAYQSGPPDFIIKKKNRTANGN